ncbi:MAG: hypothetical protein QMD46_12350 [Methanomicrobiales archaeon]|nr:hypothetical protein [Methanomicrobiales archaeon]
MNTSEEKSPRIGAAITTAPMKDDVEYLRSCGLTDTEIVRGGIRLLADDYRRRAVPRPSGSR